MSLVLIVNCIRDIINYIIHCTMSLYVIFQTTDVFAQLVRRCEKKRTHVYQLTKTSIYKLPYMI
jgi:hypothetical protein